jgi:hypothetical protein
MPTLSLLAARPANDRVEPPGTPTWHVNPPLAIVHVSSTVPSARMKGIQEFEVSFPIQRLSVAPEMVVPSGALKWKAASLPAAVFAEASLS